MNMRLMVFARRLRITQWIVAGALCLSILATSIAYWRSVRNRATAVSVPVALPENAEQQLFGP